MGGTILENIESRNNDSVFINPYWVCFKLAE